MPLIEELMDSFNDNQINTDIWTDNSGTVNEVGTDGAICLEAGPVITRLGSTEEWTLDESSVFIEVRSVPDATDATSAIAEFFVVTAAATGTRAGFRIDNAAGTITFRSEVGFADGGAVTFPYNPALHIWLRLREAGGTLFWETAFNGRDWIVQRSAASPAWVADPDLQVRLFGQKDAGPGSFACFDNLNIAPVPFGAPTQCVGSEFTTGPAEELKFDMCGADVAWPYACDVATNNGLRRSNNPQGLWAEPMPRSTVGSIPLTQLPGKVDTETVVANLTLVNPDSCRAMLFYLLVTVGAVFEPTPAAPAEGSVAFPSASLVLAKKVTGVDNSDVALTAILQDECTLAGRRTWQASADHYWTADPAASTTVSISVQLSKESGEAEIVGYLVQAAWIGLGEAI